VAGDGAGHGALFYTGSGEAGSDGVWRSLDAGTHWELLSEGLPDLRGQLPVAARGADEAYFATKTTGIYAWDAGTHRWEQLVAPEDPYTSWSSLKVAPDGAVFLTTGDRLWRSTDRGARWEELLRPYEGGQIIGFAPTRGGGYATYGFFGYREAQLMRSPDRGRTWQPIGSEIGFGTYVPAPQLVERAGVLYLYCHDYPSNRLLRSLDGGDNWQEADALDVADSSAFAVGPDGRLWFGRRQGGVGWTEPQMMRWRPPGLTPTPRATPRATAISPTGSPTGAAPRPAATRVPSPPPEAPPAAACRPALNDRDARVASAFPALGCPRADLQPVVLARESFEHGQMIWRKDLSVIYALRSGPGPGGRWAEYPDMWREGLPESDPALQPPAGLRQPVRGFGKVWREQLGGPAGDPAGDPAGAIGWATDAERGLDAFVQEWDNGLVLRLGADTVVLLRDGSWRSL
jgi:hypothetical protein